MRRCKAAGPEFGACEHEVVVRLHDDESVKYTLETPTPDFTPARLDGTEAHLGDGHEGHEDGPTVDNGPISGGCARITSGVEKC
jgi:hypothetical protein